MQDPIDVKSAHNGLPFPAAWQARFPVTRAERQAIGESRADVFRLRPPEGGDLFVKSELAGPLSELPQEIARLRWMRQMGLPCPEVLEAATENGRHWLLMTAVAGRDMASATDLTPAQAVQIIAQALRHLHALPWQECPFDHRPRSAWSMRRHRCRPDGWMSRTSTMSACRTAADVLAELLEHMPQEVDAVVAHGDACLPNLIVDGAAFSGFIDCGRLGVSDRYQDLALASRSITRNLGPSGRRPSSRPTAWCRMRSASGSTTC